MLRKFSFALLLALLISATAFAQKKTTTSAPKRNTAFMATLPSPSPLYEVRIIFRTGSADDADGKEGTAALVSDAIVEGGFGDPKNPTTKEKLAQIIQPWGDAAMPRIQVDKQATTISMTVPRDAWPEYVAKILKPMLQQPLFEQKEIDRLRKEAIVNIQSGLRFEQQEMLGLLALDSWVLAGTALDHLNAGTVKGLQAITRDDLVNFAKSHYTVYDASIATTITDTRDAVLLTSAIPTTSTTPAPPRSINAPEPVKGRSLLIVTQPNAIATGIHFGYPIPLTRTGADYWPLFVANVFLGLHRDSFGRLYGDIRVERGYNYGDYSYIEYLAARPYSLFPPPGTPRSQQYFSVWIRPVGTQYTHFVLKAAIAELDRFSREGLTPEQVAEAKVKARTLYLNYASSKGRQLGYKLDDMFYRMDSGYLDTMIKSIDNVTTAQANAAIKKYLQAANLKIVITTDEKGAEKLADDIANNTNVQSKTLEEYHISEPIPAAKQKMLAQDEDWKKYPLNIERSNIHIVKADQMFETNDIPGLTK